MKVFLNGEYMPQDEAKISPTDRGFLFGDGIYEVVRCYGGKFLSMDQHLARMAHGSAEIEISGLEDYDFASICRELIERNSLAEQGLVYLQVTRGAASPRTHAFPTDPRRHTCHSRTTRPPPSVLPLCDSHETRSIIIVLLGT